MNLVGSFALGGTAYASALLAVGLKPNERRASLRMAGKLVGRAA